MYDVGGIDGKTLVRHEAYLRSLRCQLVELRGERSLDDAVTSVLTALGG